MKRLLCYAHFGEDRQVKPFVKHALQAVSTLCTDMVFVSNSPITDADRNELSALCSHIKVNDNVGYDFYMWKLGMEAVDLSGYDEVVLMNSSVFGPLFKMEDAFQRMDRLDCDFWGITECFQMQPHIQSYFLVFSKQVISSLAFRKFWESILPYTNKLQVIQSYEVGLTQWLLESGFRPGVLCSFQEIGSQCMINGKSLRKKDNTSVKHALELLKSGSPFLKRDAVRNRKVDMAEVLALVREYSYPAELIDERKTPQCVVCPNCGASTHKRHKGVRNFSNLNDNNRYDYLACNDSGCGTVWITNPADAKLGAVAYLADHNDALYIADNMAPGIFRKTCLMMLRPLAQFVKGPSGRALSKNWAEFTNVQDSRILVAGVLLPEETELLRQSCGQIVFVNDISVPLSENLASYEKDGFDLIILAGMAEKFISLSVLLQECNRILGAKGHLLLRSPNAGALTRTIFQGYWAGLNAPDTVALHPLKSLKKQLLASGFVVRQARTSVLQTEARVINSINTLFNKWNIENASRLQGTRIVPLIVLITVGIINLLLRKIGDDYYVEASKASQ